VTTSVNNSIGFICFILAIIFIITAFIPSFWIFQDSLVIGALICVFLGFYYGLIKKDLNLISL